MASPTLTEQLLDAQVRYHLDRLTGPDQEAALTSLAHQLLDAAGRHQIADLVDAEAIAPIIDRALVTIAGSPAVGGFVDLAVEVVMEGPSQPMTLGEIVDRDKVERLLDELLGLHPVAERALDRLGALPAVGTVASRFMGRIVGEVLQANQAVADKVPGLGRLMSFGTSTASKVVGVADKQFESLLGDTVGKGAGFAVRRLNRIVLETMKDPTTRVALLQVWDAVAAQPLRGLGEVVEPAQVAPLVDAGYDLTVDVLAHPYAAELAHAMLAGFLDSYGGYTPIELLDELRLTRDDLVCDLHRLAPTILGALAESGDLEALVRAQLEPFYASAEVRALVGHTVES